MKNYEIRGLAASTLDGNLVANVEFKKTSNGVYVTGRTILSDLLGKHENKDIQEIRKEIYEKITEKHLGEKIKTITY